MLIFVVGAVLFLLELVSIQAPDALLPLFLGCSLMLGSKLMRDGSVPKGGKR
jgi:hypothetical protein